MKTLVLLLLLAQVAPALSPDELARIAPAEQTRLEGCAPIQRAVINYRETLRVRCADGAVWRIDLPSGVVVPDKRPFKAKFKNVGVTIIAVAIVVLFIAAQGRVPGGG